MQLSISGVVTLPTYRQVEAAIASSAFWIGNQ